MPRPHVQRMAHAGSTRLRGASTHPFRAPGHLLQWSPPRPANAVFIAKTFAQLALMMVALACGGCCSAGSVNFRKRRGKCP